MDVDAGNRAVELIKDHVRSTFRPGVLGNLGSFGGFFQLDVKKYKEPVLVSGTDGVGTKLKIAFMMDKHDTIGIDGVAMCVNDILVHGAEPLFFLDYIALGKLVPEKVADIVKGVADGCKMAGCALLGGETAEMPGMYDEDEYDIAGFAVGVVDKTKIIDGSSIKKDDVVIGIASSGLHSNGYSLARKVFFELGGLLPEDYIEDFGETLGEELLKPTKIYSKAVKSLENFDIHGMAHITGGGLIENLPRILPEGMEFIINKGSWEIPPVFHLIQKIGQIEDKEMYRTFNMGIGYVLVAPKENADAILNTVREQGENAWIIGQVSMGKGGVVFCQS
ncbi:phosphoribosylaminoimidazole synthetase [Tepidanaerobacter acetatoxydans Re1]|uniref:Phosphoribosylformylglycinamidine cyclo-ligase n=1 Tax=Tepidanaerobacter acetatoxydans (strain DSM 21804 / JCM 16047 / Re1) TaxID=1209989 RepID=U4QCH3_TEPAE|nr:phosphoribosylaminoimidazole synthetase [Tepidanaerobacter acetatoxydans Re1]